MTSEQIIKTYINDIVNHKALTLVDRALNDPLIAQLKEQIQGRFMSGLKTFGDQMSFNTAIGILAIRHPKAFSFIATPTPLAPLIPLVMSANKIYQSIKQTNIKIPIDGVNNDIDQILDRIQYASGGDAVVNIAKNALGSIDLLLAHLDETTKKSMIEQLAKIKTFLDAVSRITDQATLIRNQSGGGVQSILEKINEHHYEQKYLKYKSKYNKLKLHK